ncbi:MULTISPECIES: O-antigen ligase [unclassified Ectothiorhodospira]|uniref:O-antigen ligase family protein n=1 Tax=unclassified Ectothiorhodospira TaxID=2684909 RepID=UPI001EE7ACA3|nr:MULTISPECIES: hypothetical protein [unclassified Ectothiorhodospira]MCG5517206.1 hypothetical protein [Ectothiorhodospira sp. 9100]MCG5519769.1 hypothetical protein [Ectothiorhodospira sp. 9905]
MSIAVFESIQLRIAQVSGLALAMLALGMAASWPIAAPWLLGAVVLYGGLLWWRPQAFLLVIPALVPTLNLSMHTGRLYVDELDLFLLATVAVMVFRWRPGMGGVSLPSGVKFAVLLFTFSVMISLILALYPFYAPDANTWAHYTHQYHGLYAVKGLMWAGLLLMCVGQLPQAPSQLFRDWFVPGMVLGAVGCIIWVLWERATYPGLLDFSSRYRITGAFFDMHVGGPSIETHLVMSVPFVMLWGVWQRRVVLPFLAGLGIVGAAMYALAVTYSRAGYLGMGIALSVLLLGGVLALFHEETRSRVRIFSIALATMVLSVGALLWVGVGGGVLEQRMARWAPDMELRQEHWELTAELARNNDGSGFFGHGPGSFPRLYLMGNPEGRLPANFAYVMEGGRSVLRLGTGDSLFINQRLRIPWHGEYTLQLEAQSDQPTRLEVFICQKPIRYSFRCRSAAVSVDDGEGELQEVLHFDVEDLKTGPWFMRRQLVLSFRNTSDDSLIEVKRLSLTSQDGKEWLSNEDFSAAGRHWYFTTDHLWPWRVENVLLVIWLDQGWLGVLSFLLLIGLTFWHLLRRMFSGSFQDAAVLASLAGAMGIGVFSSIFWSPRLELLFFLILLLALVAGCGAVREGFASRTSLPSRQVRHKFVRESARKTA